MPKKRTHQQLADDYGMSLDQIKKLSQAGVNVYDKKEVDRKQGEKRHRLAAGATISGSGDDEMTLQIIKEKILITDSIDEVKIYKEKALALKEIINVEKTQGKLVPIEEVDERDTRIGAAVKAALDNMGAEIAGSCAGLDEVEISERYTKLKNEALKKLADNQSEFWLDKPRIK